MRPSLRCRRGQRDLRSIARPELDEDWHRQRVANRSSGAIARDDAPCGFAVKAFADEEHRHDDDNRDQKQCDGGRQIGTLEASQQPLMEGCKQNRQR